MELSRPSTQYFLESGARGVKNKVAKADLSDGDLLQRSCKGDEDAFLILYRRHQGSVFRFALYMSGSREIAEEVTQDVFLAMLNRKNRYEQERGALQGWLIGAARNLVRKHLKMLSAATSLPEGPALEGVWNDENIVEALSKEEELKDLRAAILRLPESYRETVILCDLEELSYEQAAVHLGCAVGTIRSRLHRAHALLGSRLRKQERCPA